METRAPYVVIGSFILIMVASAFLFILWLGNSQTDFDEYDIIFTERVSGLSIGAAVRFNGIQKGIVDSLSIDPENPSIVIARVHVDKDTPVKINTRVELELVGFTGLAIIQFVGGSPDAPFLRDVSNERVPRIEADTAGLTAFLEGSGDVINQVNRLLSDNNIQGIANIIANIDETTSALAENKDEIGTLVENVSKMSTDLASIISQLEAATSSIQRILDEDAPETIEDAQELMTETKQLVAEIRGVVDENRASVRVFADQGLGQVAPALGEARRLMRTLDYMLREIDRDPKAYFLGDPAPEYEGEKE